MDMIARKKRIMMDQPWLVDATGNPIAFSTNFPANLAECKAAFSPVQAGTGDPAPDNVRPITGWTGCNVWRTGKNLIPDSITYKNFYYINAVGEESYEENYRCTNEYIPVRPSTTYSVQMVKMAGTQGFTVPFYKKDKTFIERAVAISASQSDAAGQYFGTFTTPDDAYFIRFSCPLTSSNLQIELGSTATTYEPYSGAAYPVTFPAEAGTVYGGYVDYENGEVVATHKSETLDETSSWSYYGSVANNDYCATHNFKDKKMGYQTSRCDRLKNTNSAFGQPTYAAGRYSDHPSSSQVYICMPDAEITTLKGFKEWVAENPLQFCYELATPIHCQITSQLIKTLRGLNTLWSDTNGNVSLKYWKH